MRVAFIGLGNMGGPMAINLKRAGYTVQASDLSADAIAKVRVEGVADDPSTEIAEGLPSSPTIWQQWAPLPGHATPQGDAFPVMGVWIVGDEPCGLGIREGEELVTTLEDRFVPHVVL